MRTELGTLFQRTDNSLVTPIDPPIAAPPQLSQENLLQLANARVAMRKVRRAASVASFDGWTIGAFGGFTFLLGLTDPTSIVLGLAMVAIAFVELRGAGKLKQLDTTACQALAINQLVLGSLLLVYAGWRMYAVLRGGGEYDALAGSDPQMKEMLGSVADLTRMVMMAVYGALMLIALFGQGGMALYYRSRRSHIEAYLAQTPDWIVAMQRAGVSL